MVKLANLSDVIKRSDFYEKMTFFWLLIMASMTLVWLSTGDGYWEPFVTLAGILAAAFRFVFEPVYRKRQERNDTFEAVLLEKTQNLALLNMIKWPIEKYLVCGKQVVYPRLKYCCLERALASKAVSVKHDLAVWVKFLLFRSEIERFNNYLLQMESALLNAQTDDERKQLHSDVAGSKWVQTFEKQLDKLTKLINEETGIFGREEIFTSSEL